MEVATLLSGAAIPVVNLWVVKDAYLAGVLSAILGGLVVVSAAVEGLPKFHDNWLHYRALVEALAREKELYSAGAGDYASSLDEAGRKRLLVERVENLLASATSRFIETHRTEREAAPAVENRIPLAALARPFTTASLSPVNETRPQLQRQTPKTGPHKLLALDGGGIRGIISVEIVGKIEAELRAAASNPELVLANYFDYVAGTSTGAIIATLVAHSASARMRFGSSISKAAPKCFDPPDLGTARTKFDDDNLTRMLKEISGEETTLGSENFGTFS